MTLCGGFKNDYKKGRIGEVGLGAKNDVDVDNYV